MPQARRDPYSKALLFTPSVEESMHAQAAKELQKEISEVKGLKEELKKIIEENKKE